MVIEEAPTTGYLGLMIHIFTLVFLLILVSHNQSDKTVRKKLLEVSRRSENSRGRMFQTLDRARLADTLDAREIMGLTELQMDNIRNTGRTDDKLPVNLSNSGETNQIWVRGRRFSYVMLN